MNSEKILNCCLVGRGSFAIECGQLILEKGHVICAVISQSKDVIDWAKENSIEAYNDLAGCKSFIDKFDFDYLFNVLNSEVLPSDFFVKAKHSIINFSDAPEPAYAGSKSASWAIQHQKTHFGVMWHELNKPEESGEILQQVEFLIDVDEDAFSLDLKCLQKGREAFVALLDGLSIKPEKTEQHQIVKAPCLPLNIKRPYAVAIIDWSCNADQIEAMVRGLTFQSDDNVLAAPKVLFNQQYYIVSDVHLTQNKSEPVPGILVEINNKAFEVSTGSVNLIINQLHDLNGKPLDSNQIKHFKQGDSFTVLTNDVLGEINTIDKALANFEDSRKTALLNAEPVTLEAYNARPLLSPSQKVKSQIGELSIELQNFVQESFPEIPPSTVLASLYCCFLRRILDLKQLDIGLSFGEHSANHAVNLLLAPFIPFSASINSSQSPRSLLNDLAVLFDDEKNAGSYLNDLVARTPALEAVHFPVVLELLDEFSQGTNAYNETLVFSIKKGTAEYQWKYNEKSLDENSAAQFIEKFDCFLQQVLSNLDTPLANIHLISEEEINTILHEWNNTSKTVDYSLCVHQLFEAQVASRPDAIAVAFRDQEITYAELNRQANLLAQKLCQLGAGPDKLVGIFIERSIAMMVGLLAIQKAGAAYVPLDPAYPRDRVALMVSDSEAKILLTHSSLEHELLCDDEVTVLCVDKELNRSSNLDDSKNNIVTQVTADNLAYVIYTSGSTGTPKGVLVEHRNVLNFMSGMDDTLSFDENPGVWLAVTSISFDISVLELFWSLTRGFKVVLQEEEARTIGVSQQLISNVNRKVDIGLFYFSSDAGPSASGNRYKLLMEGAKFADTHDFSTVWTPERHFHLFGGLYPNPSVTSAAVAAVTDNVAIRAGSIVLPLHNTIRVAEEWSVVDNLSNGRVGLSIASGWHVNDFALKPENFKDRRQLMFDEIETVRKLWRGESIEVKNGEGDPLEIKIYPPSVQKEPPIWITTAGNIETFRQAGEGGFNVLTNLLGQSIEDLTSKIAAYREGRKQKGHAGEGNVSCMVHTFVGTDVEEVRKIVKEPFCNYLKTSFDLVKIAPWAFPAFKQPSKAAAQDSSFDAGALTPEDMDALVDHAFDRYFETAGIFGTPTSVLPLVDQLKTAGVDELACLIDFGVETDTVLNNLQHLHTLLKVSNPAAESTDKAFSISAQIEKHQVTHFQCTPSMARIFASDSETLAAISSIQKVLLGGEALPSDLATTLKQTLKGELINVYGPTETTIWSTSGLVPNETDKLTIGRPIANTNIYIFDSGMQLSPVGVPGELMIGGAGVVRGYHKRPELTAEKFIQNPLADTNDPRIYRTGDLAKYGDNGEIEFLGRLDHQVKLRGYRIELGEIESLINRHSQVKESVVVAPENDQDAQDLYAYVVVDKGGLNQSTGHWQTIWDEAYRGNTVVDDSNDQKAIEDPTFNISGWLNSYTGQQHKTEHMKEWLDYTVERILALKPKRVLEIGCGTGMILYRVAQHCESYVGVDFSESGLNMIAEQLPKVGLNNVKLVQGAANNLSLDDEKPFDLVVINSVCQYFPSAEYFVNVLSNMTNILSESGNIFIGDVRSKSLKDVFHSAIELAKAPAALTLSDLRERIQEHHENESELLVDPDFFYNLPQKIPAINHIDLQLKRGKHCNEMSAYRYDIVLQLSADIKTITEADFVTLPSLDTISALENALASASTNIVVRDIPNARLGKDFLAQAMLDVPESKQCASDLHNAVESTAQNQSQGLEPEAIYQLKTHYHVQLVWARSGKKECMDAYFYLPQDNTVIQFDSQHSAKPLAELCYEPVQKTGAYELVDALKATLRENLPEFMVPSEFIVLPAMPLTPNGKINRKALPSPEKRQRESNEAFVAPASDIEKTIAEVFQEMLNIEKIGTRDNFFNLGANSLLIAQANNRLGQSLNRQVSLVAMYRFPTIVALAEHLSGQSDNKESAEKGTARAEKRKAATAARRNRRRKNS